MVTPTSPYQGRWTIGSHTMFVGATLTSNRTLWTIRLGQHSPVIPPSCSARAQLPHHCSTQSGTLLLVSQLTIWLLEGRGLIYIWSRFLNCHAQLSCDCCPTFARWSHDRRVTVARQLHVPKKSQFCHLNVARMSCDMYANSRRSSSQISPGVRGTFVRYSWDIRKCVLV